jgi:hypothetical protein
MSTLLGHATVLEALPVGRARRNKEEASRKRARDEGVVTSLGIEIATSLHNVMEKCRTVKKWSKRTIVEEALRHYLTKEGFPPDA